MPESKKYFKRKRVKVARGDWVEIRCANQRRFKGKVLSVDGPYPVVLASKLVVFQYGLEISEADGTGYGLHWKQWLETGNDGGTFFKVKQ